MGDVATNPPAAPGLVNRISAGRRARSRQLGGERDDPRRAHDRPDAERLRSAGPVGAGQQDRRPDRPWRRRSGLGNDQHAGAQEQDLLPSPGIPRGARRNVRDDVSGAKAADGTPKMLAADAGADGNARNLTGMPGKAGADGENGQTGLAGGEIRIHCGMLVPLADVWLLAEGGRGGNGADGQQGGAGGHGFSGFGARADTLKAYGGAGGNGGNGGDGGAGGQAGSFWLHVMGVENPDDKIYVRPSVVAGFGGNGGSPGRGAAGAATAARRQRGSEPISPGTSMVRTAGAAQSAACPAIAERVEPTAPRMSAFPWIGFRVSRKPGSPNFFGAASTNWTRPGSKLR